MTLTRRTFLQASLAGVSLPFLLPSRLINTVTGPVSPKQLGLTLIHEHFLVDFIGADRISPTRWKRDAVVAKLLPHLTQLRTLGVKTVVDCTPAYLGRDPLLLRTLSDQSGVQILTNTGFYGAVDNKFLPPFAFTETADQLADRWVAEFERGIDGTDVRPGFMKISVNPGPLSELHRKLITAAARTHKRTGLTIYSHTGPFLPAFEQLDVLAKEGVAPDAFVWVHAQGNNMVHYARAARLGAWVSLDGLEKSNVDTYAQTLLLMKENGFLHRTLLSHDAGWYDPANANADTDPLPRSYTVLFDQLMPMLTKQGFTKKDWRKLLVDNPVAALTPKVRLT